MGNIEYTLLTPLSGRNRNTVHQFKKCFCSLPNRSFSEVQSDSYWL